MFDPNAMLENCKTKQFYPLKFYQYEDRISYKRQEHAHWTYLYRYNGKRANSTFKNQTFSIEEQKAALFSQKFLLTENPKSLESISKLFPIRCHPSLLESILVFIPGSTQHSKLSLLKVLLRIHYKEFEFSDKRLRNLLARARLQSSSVQMTYARQFRWEREQSV